MPLIHTNVCMYIMYQYIESDISTTHTHIHIRVYVRQHGLVCLVTFPQSGLILDVMLNQINQLEKDKDVVAQAQAIATLEALPQLSFSVVNALNSFLNDSKVLITLSNKLGFFVIYLLWNWLSKLLFFGIKAFWRLRVEAAFALANTASEVRY